MKKLIGLVYIILGTLLIYEGTQKYPVLRCYLPAKWPASISSDVIQAFIIIAVYVCARLIMTGGVYINILPKWVGNLHVFPSDDDMMLLKRSLGDYNSKYLLFGATRISFIVVMTFLFTAISALIIHVNTALPEAMKRFLNNQCTIVYVLSVYAIVLVTARIICSIFIKPKFGSNSV